MCHTLAESCVKNDDPEMKRMLFFSHIIFEFRTIDEFWDDLGAPDTVSSVQFVVQFTDSAKSGNSREELIEIFDAILFLKKWSLFQNDTFVAEQSQIYNITSFEEVPIPETVSANDLDFWMSNRDDYIYYDVIEDAFLAFLLSNFGEFIDEELAKGGTNSQGKKIFICFGYYNFL